MLDIFSTIFYKGDKFCDFQCHLVDFSSFFTRETTFVTSALLRVSQKGAALKGKNLLPMGANSFL